MRIALVCLLVFLLSASVFSAEIVVPGKIPAGVAWSLSVSLDSSDSFSEAKVSLDGKEVVKAFSNGQSSVDPFNGAQVIKAFVVDTDPNSNAGMVLFVSHIGLDAGNHSVKVSVFSNSALVSEKEQSFSVINVVEKGFEESISARVDSVEEKISSVESSLNQKILQARNELNADLASKIGAVEKQASEQASSLKNSFNEGISKIEEQIAVNKKLEAQVEELSQKQEEQETASQVQAVSQEPLSFGSLTGFAVLPDLSALLKPEIGLIVVALVAVALFGLLVARTGMLKKGISLPKPEEEESFFGEEVYGKTEEKQKKPLFGGGLVRYVQPKEEPEKQELGDVLKPLSRGKWAAVKKNEKID